MSAGELLGKTIDVVEVAVRFVLVLLLQLGIVESLVIEFRIVTSGLAYRLWLGEGDYIL